VPGAGTPYIRLNDATPLTAVNCRDKVCTPVPGLELPTGESPKRATCAMARRCRAERIWGEDGALKGRARGAPRLGGGGGLCGAAGDRVRWLISRARYHDGWRPLRKHSGNTSVIVRCGEDNIETVMQYQKTNTLNTRNAEVWDQLVVRG
jgi:hypothetical protein